VSIEATIQLAAEGDQSAWDTIVRTYWRKVFNVAYRFVGTYDEAEDLTQEIFLKVFRSLGTFDRRANFQTWLISVSRNLCIDRYRSGRRDREVFAREVDAATIQAESAGPSAYARVETQDRVALLREALRGLSPSLRTAVLLRDIHELSYQEIATRLGIAEGTVKSRINRGRAELARQIERLRGESEERIALGRVQAQAVGSGQNGPAGRPGPPSRATSPRRPRGKTGASK
jgi:RNA polymerase sigma-70 factor (ECF subfamily)